MESEDVMGNGMLAQGKEGRSSEAAAVALNVSVNIGRAALCHDLVQCSSMQSFSSYPLRKTMSALQRPTN